MRFGIAIFRRSSTELHSLAAWGWLPLPLLFPLTFHCPLWWTAHQAGPSSALSSSEKPSFPRQRVLFFFSPGAFYAKCVFCILYCGCLFTHLSPHWALRNLSRGTFYCVQRMVNCQCSVNTWLINRINNYGHLHYARDFYFWFKILKHFPISCS